MSQLGKRAGKLISSLVSDHLDKRAPPSQASSQKEQSHGQPQPQQNQSSGLFQRPFIIPSQNKNPTLDPFIPPTGSSSIHSDTRLEALRLPDDYNNIVPDFSRVGYREGHVQLPMIPVRMTLMPTSGQNSEEDDTARIQYAIDQVSALPLEQIGENGAACRGTVLLKAGVYRVAGVLVINASGVVLRGEGQGEDGTVLVATGTIQRDFILVNGLLTSDMGAVQVQQVKARTSEMMPKNGYKDAKKPITSTHKGTYIPVGATQVPVESVMGLSTGDRIVIERPGSEEWIHDLGMDQLPPRPGNQESAQWKKDTFTFRFERTILAIDQRSSTLTIDIPMVMNLDPKYPPARIFKLNYKSPIISDVGVENLRLLSECSPTDPEDEKHAWYPIVLDNVANSWVADVTTMHFVSGIYASTWSRYITIQDCNVLNPISKPKEGGRRYQFCLSGQMGLVKRCFTNNARHDFITLARVCGPNVFVDSTGINSTNDSGPHERFAIGTLYDNITCDTLNVRQRLWKGSGQGWAGAFHVVYNCVARKSNNCFQDAPGTTNWIIGFKGGQAAQPEFAGQATRMLSLDNPVEPRSLYWAQLIRRMGGDQRRVEETVGAAFRRRY